MSTLTGNLDADRIIAGKLDDQTLLELCKVDRAFNKKVCNEDFFRKRFLEKFTIPQHSLYKLKNNPWKNLYLSYVYYIELLKEIGFSYPQNSENTPKYYYKFIDAFQYDPAYGLIMAKQRGDPLLSNYFEKLNKTFR